MSRKSVQRFCGSDMHQNKSLRPGAWIFVHATGDRRRPAAADLL